MPRGPHCRCVIVHPRFQHTLDDAPVPTGAAPPADWHRLPFELLEAIAGHLERAHDVLALAAVCRDTRPLATCPTLWRRLCRCRFGVPAPEELGLAADPAASNRAFWVQLYRYNHQCFQDVLLGRGTHRPHDARLRAMGAGAAAPPLLVQLP